MERSLTLLSRMVVCEFWSSSGALLSKSAGARVVLYYFLFYKATMTILVYSFFVLPWAKPACRWMCDVNYAGVRALGTGDDCAQKVAITQACRGGAYAVYFLITIKAAGEFAACHPGNDDTTSTEDKEK